MDYINVDVYSWLFTRRAYMSYYIHPDREDCETYVKSTVDIISIYNL